MKIKILCFSLAIFLLSCTGSPELHFRDVEEGKRILLGEPIDLTIEGLPSNIDSIQYYIDNEVFSVKNGADGLVVNPDELKMGQHTTSALVFLNTGKRLRVFATFTIVPPPAKQFRYDVVNKFPHDSTAYTQGLQIEDGILYETTGIKGASTLRTVDLKSGRVTRSKKLGDNYFGEGMTFIGYPPYELHI